MATISDPRERPIAVFDSGVGGLTVLHELLVHLPAEDYIYLGDTARFPYGERTPDELASFSLEIAEELLARNVQYIAAEAGEYWYADLQNRSDSWGIEEVGTRGYMRLYRILANHEIQKIRK